MEDLSKAVLSLKDILPKDEKYEIFWATWEPVTDVWSLQLKGEKLHINVTTYTDMNKKVVKAVFENECSMTDFIHDLSIALTQVLKKYGLFGYWENWGGEFPLSLYLQLINLDIFRKGLDTNKIEAKDNYGCEADKTEISDEIQKLLQSLKC